MKKTRKTESNIGQPTVLNLPKKQTNENLSSVSAQTNAYPGMIGLSPITPEPKFNLNTSSV